MSTIQELQHHLEHECDGGPYVLTRPWKSGWSRKQRNQIIEYTRRWIAKKRKNPNVSYSDANDLLHNISKDNRTNHAKRKFKAACREAIKAGKPLPPRPKRGRPRKTPLPVPGPKPSRGKRKRREPSETEEHSDIAANSDSNAKSQKEIHSDQDGDERKGRQWSNSYAALFRC